MNMKKIGLTVIMVLCVICTRFGAESEVAAASKPTLVLPAVITPASVPPGAVVKVRFNWQAGGPLKHMDSTFVHFIGNKGVVYTENPWPGIATDSVDWKGKISYTYPFKLPETMTEGTTKVPLAAGKYQVGVGFNEPLDGSKDKSDIQALAAGEGVSTIWADCYIVGTVTVDPKAPLPKADTEGAKTLDLSGYKMVFSEEFNGPLDVSPLGPGTRWIAHPPWNADYWAEMFADPEEGFPFTINKGILRIEARKDMGQNEPDQGAPVQGTLWIDDVTAVAGTKTKVVNDFEAAQFKDWKYTGGEEFAGAKGSFTRDTTVVHGGKGSGKLEADFSGGGAWVGTLCDLSTLNLPDLTEFHVWVKARNMNSLTVRIYDATGQCHQQRDIPLAATKDWQEVVLNINSLVTAHHVEFWDGANDGKWHGPIKTLGLNIDKSNLHYGKKWRSGLLSSCDPEGKGFAQKYGYFEFRAKLPTDPGLCPSIKLYSAPPEPAAGVDVRKNNSLAAWMQRFDAAKQGDLQIDVLEFYGHMPEAYTERVFTWVPGPMYHAVTRVYTRPNEIAEGFHNYGVMVNPDFITMYFDGVEVWKTYTPRAHQRPLMMLFGLGLGAGWPIDKVPNPSYMYVDYVRAYARNGVSAP